MRVKMLDPLGNYLEVPEARVEFFKGAGYKPASVDSVTEQPKEEDKPKRTRKTVKK